MNFSPWSLTLKIIAGSFHSVAVASTIFRLTYRWYMARFWWEDGWAAFALVVDVLCLVGTFLEVPWNGGFEGMPSIDNVTNWIAALGFPSVLWACRISILLSIVRITNPSRPLRRIAFLVGVALLIMWAVLMGQKLKICVSEQCKIAGSVGISQLITDVLSDTVLVGLPVYLLRQTRISHRQRIMLFSVFSACILITLVTVLHSVVLLKVQSSGIIVIGHVKTALSLIVCNLLVIVTFVYRVCRRGKAGDLDVPEEVPYSLTSVDLDVDFTFSTAPESAVDSGMTPTIASTTTRMTTITRTTASDKSCTLRVTEPASVREKADTKAPGSGSGSGSGSRCAS